MNDEEKLPMTTPLAIVVEAFSRRDHNVTGFFVGSKRKPQYLFEATWRVVLQFPGKRSISPDSRVTVLNRGTAILCYTMI